MTEHAPLSGMRERDLERGASTGTSAGPTPLGSGSERGTFLHDAWTGIGLLGTLVLAGMIVGGTPASAAKVLAFLGAWVLLPGLAFQRFFGAERDRLTAVALGLALGVLFHGFVVFACRATGNWLLHGVWPLSALLVFALPRGAPRSRPRTAGIGGEWLFALPLAVILLRAPLHEADPGAWWWGFDPDLLFHAGNVAELGRSGPLLDPRVGGAAFNYHLFAHTLIAGCSAITELPIAELVRAWLPGFYPLCLVLLVFVLARELSRSAIGGLVAALVLVLHTDLGVGFHLLGWGKRSFFLSYLDLGLFHSLSTECGLTLLLAIAFVLVRLADPSATPPRRRWVQLGLLGLGASFAKGSVMPVVLAGSGLALLVESFRLRRLQRRWLAVLLVLAAVALPGTLFLAFGAGSYAGAMLRPAPFASVYLGDLVSRGLQALDLWNWTLVPWIGLLLTPLWVVAYCQLTGLGILAWLVARRPALDGIGAWILGVCCAGFGFALGYLAPGHSQLFFAYDAQVLLGVVTGVAAASLLRERRRMAALFLVAALPYLVAGLGGVVGYLKLREGDEHARSALWPQWIEGARWLEEHAEPDALLVARHDGIHLSVFAERRTALEHEVFRPEFHGARWRSVRGKWHLADRPGSVFPELRAARDGVLDRPDVESIAHLREVTRHTGPIYLVSDSTEVDTALVVQFHVQPRPERPELDASPLLERCFANEALAIYRVRDR